jgi:shikimate kinase
MRNWPHAPQDRLVIPPVVVIGPVSVGKSTIAGLLADRLGWPHVSMDAVCAAYYAEISFDQAVSNRRQRTHGVKAAYQYWKLFEAYAVERILADHKDAVIDLGGGHSVQEDGSLFARVRAALAPVRNVVLLLPSPDPEESVRILTERKSPPEGFDWHRHFVTHPSNGALAKLMIYTIGQTPEQTCDAVYQRLFRTTS